MLPERRSCRDSSTRTAHLHYASFELFPQQKWEYIANLAYGVTTSFDPSAHNIDVFSQAEMVEAGEMLGPRIYSTGDVIYGTESNFPVVYENIRGLDAARDVVKRFKAYNPAMLKEYMQLRRDERQWVKQAAREEGIRLTSEGGADSDSVLVYNPSGEMARLAVPTEFTDRGASCKVKLNVGTVVGETSCTNWARELRPTLDGQGNLVLLSRDQEVPGTIVDPETGCYAIVRKPEASWDYGALHIYQDSALVFRYATWEAELPPGVELPAGAQVQPTISTAASRSRVSLHPLRRVSGEPCPGMLPSVN